MGGYLTSMQSDVQKIETGIKALAPSFGTLLSVQQNKDSIMCVPISKRFFSVLLRVRLAYSKSDFDNAAKSIGNIANNFDTVSDVVRKVAIKFQKFNINSGSTIIEIGMNEMITFSLEFVQ